MANRRTTRMQNKRKLEALDPKIEAILDTIVTVGDPYKERYPEITSLLLAAFEGLEMVQKIIKEANSLI